MNSQSLPPWPDYSPGEVEAVQRVLQSNKVNYWTGDEGKNFEREFAQRINANHAVALANGTVALELAVKVLGIGPGDEVVVTPRTFVASASSIALHGAIPVFADVDPVSQNLTAESVSQVLSPRTKAIMAVHLAGWPCEMDELQQLADEHGLKVIEDCAQAHGAEYRDQYAGTFGDAAAFSFCQDKILTTGGEGGMLILKDEALWQQAWGYKDHGKAYDTVYHREHAIGYRWLHEALGTNWRITEMQAAIGRIQVKRLTDWVNRRRKHAAVLTKCFLDIPGLRVTVPPEHIKHAYYKYYVFIELESLRANWNRDRILQAINDSGVPCMTGTCPEVYLEKAVSGMGTPPQERLPVAKMLGDTSLMFMVHPTLEAADIEHFCDVVKSVMAQAVK